MANRVLITGGTRGIGLGIARAYLRQNDEVVLVYRSDKEQAEKVSKELGVQTIQADITNPEERERLFEVDADILINNAAIIRKGRTLDISEKDLEEVNRCNFIAPIMLAQGFANKLVTKNKGGSIVNILSVGAYGAGNLAYCTSKAALLLATKCMARELAKHEIRVNAVSPFGVATELNREAWEKNPEAWEKLIQMSPMKRASTEDEVAAAVLYLTSEAAAFTTGIDIPVDGGLLTR